jgi:hypothetical protein
MSLLLEIQNAAVDSGTPLTDVLRKCAVLASRLGNRDLRDWVQRELNGYPEEVEVPSYRIIYAQAKGHFSGPFGSGYRNLAIPASALPEKYRDFGERLFVKQPIAACIALAETDPVGSLSSPWPGDLLAVVGLNLFQGLQCYGAWQQVSHAAFVGLCDAVRNRILDFALQLGTEAPEAGESPGSMPISNERVTHLYQTIIVGNVGNVATASPQSVQVSPTVLAGDFESLKRALTDLGLAAGEVAELELALKEDGGRGTIGSRTLDWIGKSLQKASSGALKIGSGTAIGVIVKLICQYLGIS